MNIIAKIFKGEELFGYQVEDAGEKYPIYPKGLHNPTVLDELLKEGWELVSLPFGLEKDGLRLEDLETIKYEDLNLSDLDLQYMDDQEQTVYPNAVLLTKVSRNSEESLYEFKKGVGIIKTREEFLKFLDSIAAGLGDKADTFNYMPLNYFVAPAALFTPDEYFAGENDKYRKIIENRRFMEYSKFCLLVKTFVKEGLLTENYTAKQLTDMYFSWGICGLRFKTLNYERKESPTILGANVNWNHDDNIIPFNYRRELSYLKADGDTYRNATTKSSTWAPVSIPDKLTRRAQALARYGEEYIEPELLESRIIEELTVITGEDIRIVFNESDMQIEYKDVPARAVALKVKRIGSNNVQLSSRFSNIYSKDENNDLANYLTITALSNAIAQKVTVKTTASSYKALFTMGAGPKSVFNYILNQPGIATEYSINRIDKDSESYRDLGNMTAEEKKQAESEALTPQEFTKLIERYLNDDLPESDQYYETVKYTVQSIMDGELNVDGVQKGETADSGAQTSESYNNYLLVAQRFLGLSLNDLYNKVEELNTESRKIEFEGNGLKMIMPISPVNSKERGYFDDIENYKAIQSDKAPILGYITKAWRELSTSKSIGRHIGFEMQMIDMTDSKVAARVAPIIKMIDDVIIEEIRNNFIEGEDLDFDRYMSTIGVIRSESLFRIIKLGEYVMPPKLGGKKYIPSQNVIDTLRSFAVRKIYDSTLQLADNTINIFGNPIVYCVNAIVTPEYIIPRGTYKIEEYSFVPMWLNTAGTPQTEQIRGMLLKNELIPNSDFNGAENEYLTEHLPKKYKGVDIDIKVEPRSLFSYKREADKLIASTPADVELKTAVHVFDKLYGDLLGRDLNANKPRTDGSTEPHKWISAAKTMITQKDVISRSPYLLDVFKPDRKALEAPKTGFYWFKGFEALDYITNQGKDVEDLVKAIDGEYSVSFLGDNGESAYFTDETTAVPSDIEKLYSTGKYKIRQISGRKYLCEDVFGKLIEVRV